MTKRRTTQEGNYTLHGHQLQSVPHAKYLGVTISADLKWDMHTNSVISKANKTLGFLGRNLRLWDKQVKGMRRAYKALVCPLQEYASPVWDPLSITCTDFFEKV